MAIDKVGAIGGAGATPALESSGKAQFGKVLEGVKGQAKQPGPQVATEGSPRLAPAERTEAPRGTCKAEGVERAGQLHELRRQGCDLVQGHFVARPATGAQLTPAVLADLPILAPHLRGLRASDKRLAAGRGFRPVSEPG